MTRRDPDATIREALRARADLVQPENLRAALPPTAADHHETVSRRWLMPTLVAAAAAAVVLATVVGITRNGTHHTGTPPLSAPATTSAPTATSPAPTQTSTTPTTSAPSTSAPSTFDLGYEPLWPFANYAAAEHWRTTAGGSQPWHADACETALAFTRGYLGFTESDRVT